jgi:hypothetical protein
MARGLDLTGQVWVLLFSQAIASVLFDLKKCQARYP